MTTTKKKRRKKSVKKLKYSNKKLNFVHVATLAGVILILLVIILAARGCGGISHRTAVRPFLRVKIIRMFISAIILYCRMTRNIRASVLTL